MVDHDVLRDRMKFFQKMRGLLDGYKGETFEEFTGGHEHYTAAEHELQLALQAVLDIARHIVATHSLEKPEEMKKVFFNLAELGILDKPLAERLVKAAGARNVLVHGYLEVDPKIIYKIIQNDLPDLDRFAAAIDAYLKKIPA
ncbi:MAG: DUF86 domain-containing protein [bacterium]|nr:DUF86 domain-containing protein [bacterium]